MLALAFFIVGFARPQFGSKLKNVKREGVELIIALDVSNSMMAEDIQPNRLERAKRAIARLVDRLRDDKIGLINIPVAVTSINGLSCLNHYDMNNNKLINLADGQNSKDAVNYD